MSTTTKSPRKVFLAVFEIGQRTLKEYSHECSPKKFTQPQLFACLVLKSFLKVYCRGVVELLNDCPDLRDAIGMKSVPHFTTLHKACRRLIRLPLIEQMLVASLRIHSPRRRRIRLDQREKSIVFCKTQLHAAIVRDLINQMKDSTNPDYCCRVTADDGGIGEQHLWDFQDNEKTIPTVLTTSQKLSTGVDARNVEYRLR
jgi:hypothetical protein